MRPSEQRLDRFQNDVVRAMQCMWSDDVGRQHVNPMAERTQQYAAVKKKTVELRPHRRKITSVFCQQFDGADRADLPGIAALMQLAELPEPLGVDLRDRVDAIENRLVFENLQTPVCGRERQRIPGNREPLIKGALAVLSANSR